MNQKEILKSLQTNLNCRNLKLPQDINFAECDGNVTIILSEKAIGLGEKPYNMQNAAAAFEGWALALYVHLLREKGTVTLDAPVSAYAFDAKRGHFHRFLYRALRFSEQFPWFRLAPALGAAAAVFRKELESGSFINNFPNGEAGESGSLENAVEAQMAKQNDLLQWLASAAGQPIGETPIYRQLPVGLFREAAADEKNRVFSGGKSAIDLWTCDGNTISIFELKAHNKMIGMVTELFFYANYMHDMFCTGGLPGFRPLQGKAECRGYGALLPQGDKIHRQIQAFFLYDGDQIHPLISEEVVSVLNQGSEQIQYARLSYKLELILK